MSWSPTKRAAFLLVIGFLGAGALLAQVGATVPNWTVPPYRVSSGSGGYSTMADISNGAIFVAVTPCRVLDTRGAAGPYGGPALVPGPPRVFDIDSGPCTGIPAGTAAYSLSIGGIVPPADGFLKAWPVGSTEPLVSQLNMIGGEVVANAAIVPGGTGGSINVVVSTGPVHIYIDINGYFMDSGGTLNDGLNLQWHGNTSNSFMFVRNNFTGAGIDVFTAAIRGFMDTTANNVSSVIGENNGDTGLNYGVTGDTESATVGAAGVRGLGGGGSFNTTNLNPDAFRQAAVKAVGRDANGVNAFASGLSSAVSAHTVAADGGILAQTYLGWNEFFTFGLLVSEGNAVINDNLTVGGTKSFAQPHPTDASKQIRYISVEAPAAEIYFRGTAQVSRGVTRIEVPESFRLVAKADTYATIVTPVGGMATVAVMREGPDGIVLQASRDVKVHYVVHGIREGFEDHQAIEPNMLYQPMFEGRFLGTPPDLHRRLMIQNGTLNPDGTANVETARRLGWTLRPESENPMRVSRPE